LVSDRSFGWVSLRSITSLCEIAKKKEESPMWEEACQCHSPGSQGSPSMKSDLKIQSGEKLVSDRSSLSTLYGALCLSLISF
jgi:hypothetical protein